LPRHTRALLKFLDAPPNIFENDQTAFKALIRSFLLSPKISFVSKRYITDVLKYSLIEALLPKVNINIFYINFRWGATKCKDVARQKKERLKNTAFWDKS